MSQVFYVDQAALVADQRKRKWPAPCNSPKKRKKLALDARTIDERWANNHQIETFAPRDFA